MELGPHDGSLPDQRSEGPPVVPSAEYGRTGE
jgi:hypothetical protein